MIRWIMILCGTVVVLVLLTSQYGCSTAVNRADSAADTIVESSKALHDKQVEAGQVLTCGAPFRALIAHYHGDPIKLRAVMVLCGFEEILEAIWPSAEYAQ